mgnify:CR=1 FL=1
MAKNKKRLPQQPGEIVSGKWLTKKKIIAASVVGVVVVAAIILAVVLAFNWIRPIESTEEEARVVGTVGDFEVRYEELRYITLLHRASLDSEMGKYDELDAEGKAEYERILEERVMADVENNYVILSLCEKYGINADSNAAKSYVNDSIKNVVKTDFGGSVDKYKEWLKKNNITDSVLRLLFKVEYLEGELSLEEAKEKSFYDDWHLAKRQMTWFKRNPSINWMSLEDAQKIDYILKSQ